MAKLAAPFLFLSFPFLSTFPSLFPSLQSTTCTQGHWAEPPDIIFVACVLYVGIGQFNSDVGLSLTPLYQGHAG